MRFPFAIALLVAVFPHFLVDAGAQKHGYLMFDQALYDGALQRTGEFLTSLGFLDANKP